MQSYLEYHPQLSYKRELMATLIDQAQQVEELPQTIQEALQITPTDILVQLETASTSLQAVKADLLRALRSKLPLAAKPIPPNSNKFPNIPNENAPLLANALTIDDYIKAREQKDMRIVSAFEAFHSQKLEGLPEAEALSVLLDFEKEIESLKTFTDKQLFNGKASQLEMAELRKNEENQIRAMLADYVQGRADLDTLSEENHIKDFLMGKGTDLDDVINGLSEAVNMKLNSIYGGAIPDMVHLIGTSSQSLLPTFRKVNAARFENHAADSEDALDRMRRLGGSEVKMALLEETVAAQKTKLENRELIDWVDINRPESDLDPLNMVMLDLLDGIQESNRKADSAVSDLYMTKYMESTQTMDYLRAFANKKSAREMDTALSIMSDHLTPDMGPEQIGQFIQSFKLDAK